MLGQVLGHAARLLGRSGSHLHQVGPLGITLGECIRALQVLVVLHHESVELVLDVLLDLLGLLGLHDHVVEVRQNVVLGLDDRLAVLGDHLVDLGQVGLNLVELRDADLDLVDEAQAHVGVPDNNRVVAVRTARLGAARAVVAGAHVLELLGLLGREDLLVVLRVLVSALSSEAAVRAKAAHLAERHLDCRL